MQVTRAFSEVKTNALRQDSLHYEGRALDVTLVSKPANKLSKLSCFSKLKELAWIAKIATKFDFVELKSRHIHVSCRKDRFSK